MTATIVAFLAGVVVGSGGGIWAWSKYKAKLAAEIQSVAK